MEYSDICKNEILRLDKLTLLHFKNYASLALSFDPGVNCLFGRNGIGKTNLLDAIHYLSLTKSYFNPIDKQVVKHGEKMMMVKGDFEEEDQKLTISVALRQGQKKQVKKNKKEYEKISEHIGNIPVVMITPFDSFLILEGSDVRRKFMDSIISQEDGYYLHLLLSYNRVLQQRNQLLKQTGAFARPDPLLFESWNQQLVEYGKPIFKRRVAFMERFIQEFNAFYKEIGGMEDASIQYDSSLHSGDFLSLLEASLKEDLRKQYTTVGIHKDDLIFQLGEYPIKRFGSQGQQKTFLLALKLAQFRHMKSLMKKTPILLLDDIYDKLDATRMKRLMDLVSSEGFHQVFITDTHPTRVKELLQENGIEATSIDVNKCT
jgi:DNA replication and repair protein RecF